MGNFLPDETVNEILTGLHAGMSIRAVSRMAGVSTNTVRRYVPKGVRLQCICGGPAGHKGWCRERYQMSPVRQAYHARRKGVFLHVPAQARRSRVKEARTRWAFVFGLTDNWRDRATPIPRGEHYGVIGEVHEATKRTPVEAREDVRQSLILAVYEGRVLRHQIPDVVGAFYKQEMRNTIGSIWSLWMSLDEPLAAGSPVTFMNLLSEAAFDGDGIWRPQNALNLRQEQ